MIIGSFSGLLLGLGLYMLETIEWHKSWGFTKYVLPFGFEYEWWVARDIAYMLIILSYILIISLSWGRLRWGRRGRREER